MIIERSLRQNKASFPELDQLEKLLSLSTPNVQTEIIAQIPDKQTVWPLYKVSMGSTSDDCPVLLLVAGVHGIERIGSQVLLAFMETLFQQLHWDHSLQERLRHLRLVFLPILNPSGMYNKTRSNNRGVDLMRNAPIDAHDPTVWLFGGQRISRHLPYYRGAIGQAVEPENTALFTAVKKEYYRSPLTLALDIHSGFGAIDRLWFPLAGCRHPIESLSDYYQLKQLLDQTYPHLDYCFEPQATQYITHGDVWDYLYLDAINAKRYFLPLTLEMGSWRWIRKNPLQIFRLRGLFHPTKPHRIKRVLRRHIILMEFLIRATSAYSYWLTPQERKTDIRQTALKYWFDVTKK